MVALFDAHSHLPDPASPRAGHYRVVCGTCEADWKAILAHAASDARVIPMLGLHPWHVEAASPEWVIQLEALLRGHRAGLGECGLDFARKDSDRAAQIAAFRLQLRLAVALHRPVAMHVVRGWGPLLEILREEGVPPAGAMIHAFSGSPGTAHILQAMGVFLSFSGELLNPDRPKLRESLRAVALSHLLLETDGTADLGEVIDAAATLRGASVADLRALCWENGRRCFQELLT